jgi:hypothetical protein
VLLLPLWRAAPVRATAPVQVLVLVLVQVLGQLRVQRPERVLELVSPAPSMWVPAQTSQ